jgi:hypothetical protein
MKFYVKATVLFLSSANLLIVILFLAIKRPLDASKEMMLLATIFLAIWQIFGGVTYIQK